VDALLMQIEVDAQGVQLGQEGPPGAAGCRAGRRSRPSPGRSAVGSSVLVQPVEGGAYGAGVRLAADELDRLVERGAARTGVTHRRVLVPDRHAAEEDEPVRG